MSDKQSETAAANPRCATCRFGDFETACTTGLCRRYPPALVVLEEREGQAVESWFPDAWANEWCGEWQPKVEPDRKPEQYRGGLSNVPPDPTGQGVPHGVYGMWK